MAFVPPRKLRELVLKYQKGETTPEENYELAQRTIHYNNSKSTTSDFNPALGMLYTGWVTGMFG